MGLGTEYVDGGAVTAGRGVVVVVGRTVVLVVVVGEGSVVVGVVVTRAEVVDGGVLLVDPPPHPAKRTEMTRVAITATRDVWHEECGERHRRNTRGSLVT